MCILKESKHKSHLGPDGGQVACVLAFYSGDLSWNPACSRLFFRIKLLLKGTKLNKRARGWSIKNTQKQF